MQSRSFLAGVTLAVGTYVLAAGVVAYALPGGTASVPLLHADRQAHDHPHGHGHSHGHAHIDPDQAEQLTGPFGAHGDRHPPAQVFSTAEDGLTERRRRSMSAKSGHFRALSATLLSEAGGDDMVQIHADALALLGSQIDRLFEIDSPAPDGETGALPAIWDAPERFALYTAAFADEAARFAQTVRDGGDLVNGLHDLRYYCVACHADFRQR